MLYVHRFTRHLKMLVAFFVTGLAVAAGTLLPVTPANAVLPTGVVGHASPDDGFDDPFWVRCRAGGNVRQIAEGYDSRDYCGGAGRVDYIIVRKGTKVTCQNGDVYTDNYPSSSDRYHAIGVAEYVGDCWHGLVNYWP